MNTLPRRLAIHALCLAVMLPSALARPQDQDQHQDPNQDAVRQNVLSRLAEIELTITVDRDLDGARKALANTTSPGGNAHALRDDEAVATAVQRIEQILAEASGETGSAIAEAVQDSLILYQFNTLPDLGEPAFIELERLVRQTPGDISKPLREFERVIEGADPLHALAFHRPSQAVELVMELQASGRPVDPMRIINAGMHGVITNADRWSRIPGRSPQFDEPRWILLVAEAIAEEIMSGETLVTWVLRGRRDSGAWNSVLQIGPSTALQKLAEVLRDNDAFEPDVSDALLRAARRGSPTAGLTLARAFQPGGICVLPSALGLYEGLTDEPLVETRRIVARRLAEFDVGPSLLGLADDSDWQVRWSVAEGLGVGKIRTLSWDGSGRSDIQEVVRTPELDGSAVGVLRNLLQDVEPGVRHQAVRSLVSHPAMLLPEDVYESLARDEDALVREALVAWNPQDPAQRVEVLSQLARDRDPRVLKAVDVALQDAAVMDGLRFLLPVLVIRTQSEQHALWSQSPWFDAARFAGLALDEQEVFTALMRVGLRESHTRMLEVIYRWVSSSGRVDLLVADLGPDEAAQSVTGWLRWLDQEQVGKPNLSSELRNFQVWAHRRGPETGEIFALMLADPELDIAIRCLAAGMCARADYPRHRAAIVQLLSGEECARWILDPRSEGWSVRSMLVGLDVQERDALLLALMDTDMREDALLSLLEARVEQHDFKGARAVELALAVFERWHPSADANVRRVLNGALAALAERPDELPAETWVELSRDPTFTYHAARGMANSRNEGFIDSMKWILMEDGGASKNSRESWARQAAIRGLTARLSDEAAEALLDAAALTSSAEVREECMEGVATIQQYQEARAAWDRRTASRATRNAAVQRLVGMLGDEQAEVRREAARGLGALSAVEHIPDLIALLGDGDAGVRAAAQEALDRLNRVEPITPPTPATDDGPR